MSAQPEPGIDFLQALIRLVPQGEAAVQAHVAEALRALGCEVEVLRYSPGDVTMRDEFAAAQSLAAEPREAVVARLRGSGGGRSVMFFAHPDGEAVRGTEGWTHPPFEGVVADGRLHGWGVSDDLAGVANMVDSLRLAVSQGGKLRGDVIMASTPSKRHARGMAAVMQHGYLADAAVYLHPAESGEGMREVKTFAGGQLLFTITIAGRQPPTSEPGHTAFAHLAVNPADKLVPVLQALRALDASRGERIRNPSLQDAIGRSTNLQVGSVAAPGKAGRVPLECVVTCALSFPPGEPMASAQAEVEAALREAAQGDDWLCENPPVLAWLSGVTGAEVAPDHPLYQVVSRAVQDGTGKAPHVNVLHTSSDIRVPMVQQGIPCVGLGPLGGDLTQNGRHNEWVDVADYQRGVIVVAGIITVWCS
jgi:acetylornithine deacetylase/succinyl-diaminopimelate desuccinylase-like protein